MGTIAQVRVVVKPFLQKLVLVQMAGVRREFPGTVYSNWQ